MVARMADFRSKNPTLFKAFLLAVGFAICDWTPIHYTSEPPKEGNLTPSSNKDVTATLNEYPHHECSKKDETCWCECICCVIGDVRLLALNLTVTAIFITLIILTIFQKIRINGRR